MVVFEIYLNLVLGFRTGLNWQSQSGNKIGRSGQMHLKRKVFANSTYITIHKKSLVGD